MGEEKTLPVCPRCGAPYRHLEYKEINGRTYVYAYHGKAGRRPQLCYLGPADSYAVVEGIIPLGLRNAEDVDLVQVAFNAASLYQVRMRRKGESERREAAEKLKRLAEDILQLAQNLEQ
jgi:phage protein U